MTGRLIIQNPSPVILKGKPCPPGEELQQVESDITNADQIGPTHCLRFRHMRTANADIIRNKYIYSEQLFLLSSPCSWG